MKLNLYSDGGARGNPGPAAGAYVVLAEKGEVMKTGSFFLGKRTNNQAEYEALIAALQTAEEMRAEEIVCHLDSELVCKHLTGKYRIRNPELLKLWIKTQEIKKHFRKVSFVNVPRTNRFIQKADKLVNLKLDESTGHSQ